jgi:hypothetical protein
MGNGAESKTKDKLEKKAEAAKKQSFKTERQNINVSKAVLMHGGSESKTHVVDRVEELAEGIKVARKAYPSPSSPELPPPNNSTITKETKKRKQPQMEEAGQEGMGTLKKQKNASSLGTDGHHDAYDIPIPSASSQSSAIGNERNENIVVEPETLSVRLPSIPGKSSGNTITISTRR